MKKFLIEKSSLRMLLPFSNGCIASDRITVGGCKVGYMYREEPDDTWDSGWRFFAGDESQEYADDPNNFEMYKLNTIANYDEEIIPLLDCLVGSAFERNQVDGHLLPIEMQTSED